MPDEIRSLLEDATSPDRSGAGRDFDELWTGGRTRRRRTQVAAAAAGVVATIATVVAVVAVVDQPVTPEVVTPPGETATESTPSPDDDSPSPRALPPATPEPSPPDPSTSESTSESTSDGDDQDQAAATTVRDDLEFFQSPSGNIVCWFGAGSGDGSSSVECLIQEFSYQPVWPGPGGCELDWGNILVATAGEAGFACYSDAYFIGVDGRDVWDPSVWPVAEYGTTVVRGGIECRSERTGVTCTTPSGNGFSVARAAYDFFGPDATDPPAAPDDPPSEDEPVADDARQDLTFFRTASGAIHCRYLEWFDGSLECLMTEVSPDAVVGGATSAARSACADDQVQAFMLSGGSPSFTCVGPGRYQSGVDAPADLAAWPVVEDEAVARHGIRCEVEGSTMTCVGSDGYGFTLTPTTFEQLGPGRAEVPEP